VPVKYFFAYLENKKARSFYTAGLWSFRTRLLHHRPARLSGFCPDVLDHTVATTSFIELSIPFLLQFIYHFEEKHA